MPGRTRDSKGVEQQCQFFTGASRLDVNKGESALRRRPLFWVLAGKQGTFPVSVRIYLGFILIP